MSDKAKQIEIGTRFFRLIVIGRGPATAGGDAQWHVRCDCGVEKYITGWSLRALSTKSCGCWRRELMAKRQHKHGKSFDPIYVLWASLKHRHKTGDLQLVKEWMSFETFASQIDSRPTVKHVLRAINPNLPIGPDNHCWIRREGSQYEPCLSCGNPRHRNGKTGLCARCFRERRSGAMAIPTYIRNHRLKKTYGITAEEWDEIFSLQGGCCAICRKPGDSQDQRAFSFNGLVVDHEHSTEKVRGLLCNRCNLGLGYFQDRADILATATAYLLNSPASQVLRDQFQERLDLEGVA